MQEYDGGEAILEAFRNLGVDYIISSPGSEWAPVWEALARQKTRETPGPTYINCWHETLAVNMALGYTRITGKLQAVLLHAGVGLLQGSIGIHGANQGEVPILICSGEANSYGENPELDPQGQWYRNLSVVGGPNRFVDPFTKWSGQATSPYTLYEQLIRAGEMAQRVPLGPTFLDIPIETMIHPWNPPQKMRQIPTAPKTQPSSELIDKLSAMLISSTNPLIITESAGKEPAGFNNLVELSNQLAIPVIESSPTYSNFPKSHPMHLGFDPSPLIDKADLVLVIGSRSPWYPPSAGPTNAKVIAIDENPIKGQMVHQNLMADMYIEGDLTTTLELLNADLKTNNKPNAAVIHDRWIQYKNEHDQFQEKNRISRKEASNKTTIDPIYLCQALSEIMPDNAVYVEETTSHRNTILQHVNWETPHSYIHPHGGLGQGLGLALGVKLAKPNQPVIALMGDGGLLYNPITQSFGVAGEANLPFLTIVFNNGNYEAMRRNHLHYYPNGEAFESGIFHGVHIPSPEYSELVTPFGGYGIKVESPSELGPALASALEAVNNGKLAIVDVLLDK